MKRILCAVCVSLIGLQAIAGEVDDNLKKLETALQKSAKEQGKSTDESEDSERPGRATLSSIVPILRANIAQKDLNSVIQMLQKYSSSPLLSEEAQKASQELLAALNKEQDERNKAVLEPMEQVLKHAADVVRTAKTTADLDTVLTELAALKNRQENRQYSEKIQSLRNKAEQTYRFVSRWQDYLAAQAAGNGEQWRKILRDLADSEVLLVPRSELLAKAEEPQRPLEEIADELIAKTKNLDEVGGLIKEIRKLDVTRRFGNYNSGNLQAYIQPLQQMDQNYREFQAGLATNIEMATNSNSMPAALAPLKTQLLLLVLPRYISAPAGIKPKAGEGVVEFLNRVAEEAKARGDVALSVRSREALRQMQRTTAWSFGDTQALSAFQAAQNQKEAGQYMLAVVSYQNALKGGSDVVPAKLIGERLAEIQKQHPEDYAKGTERFLNPPPIQYPPGYNPMTQFPMGMPMMSGTPGAPKLVIPPPPATPTATAVAPTPQPSSEK